MARTTRALAGRDPTRRTLAALGVLAGLLGALAAFGFDPAHAAATFTADSTNDWTNIKLADAQEVSA